MKRKQARPLLLAAHRQIECRRDIPSKYVESIIYSDAGWCRTGPVTPVSGVRLSDFIFNDLARLADRSPLRAHRTRRREQFDWQNPAYACAAGVLAGLRSLLEPLRERARAGGVNNGVRDTERVPVLQLHAGVGRARTLSPPIIG